eukprot:1799086-Pleurochrysis_carterae.AAC.1
MLRARGIRGWWEVGLDVRMRVCNERVGIASLRKVCVFTALYVSALAAPPTFSFVDDQRLQCFIVCFQLISCAHIQRILAAQFVLHFGVDVNFVKQARLEAELRARTIEHAAAVQAQAQARAEVEAAAAVAAAAAEAAAADERSRVKESEA